VNGVLQSVMEARRLAPVRAVTPADLRWMGTMLPPIWLPATTSGDVTAMNLGDPGAPPPPPPSTPTTPITPAVNVLGKV
jgi:hypothetical protein